MRKAAQPAAGTTADSPEAPGRHPLVDGVRQFFLIDRKTDVGYLRPRKRSLVDVVVSESMIDTALDVANECYLFLERHGLSVGLAPTHIYARRPPVEIEGPRARYAYDYPEPWRPSRPTVVFVGNVGFGLTLFEPSESEKVHYVDGSYIRETELTPRQQRWMQRHRTWDTTQYLPTGRLTLRAYAVSGGVDWQQEWPEKAPGELSHRFRTVEKVLREAVPHIEELLEQNRLEAERQRQARGVQQRERERQEAERRRAEALKESRDQLLAIVDEWALACQIESFFGDLEQRVSGDDDAARQAMSDRLREARDILGTTDSLRHFGAWRSPAQRLERATQHLGGTHEDLR